MRGNLRYENRPCYGELWGKMEGKMEGKMVAKMHRLRIQLEDPVAGTARLKPADQIAHESRPLRTECEGDGGRIPPTRIQSSAEPL